MHAVKSQVLCQSLYGVGILAWIGREYLGDTTRLPVQDRVLGGNQL